MVTRHTGGNTPKSNMKVGLPYRPFLFTVDQISALLSIGETILRQKYIYFEGRSTGIRSHDMMIARNIGPREESPEWRIAERELLRWMKRKGFRHYEGTNLLY